MAGIRDINILTWNIRGLKSTLAIEYKEERKRIKPSSRKNEVFLEMIQNCDVLCLLETLTKLSKEEMPGIPGFDLHDVKPASGNRSGGLAVYLRQGTDLTLMQPNDNANADPCILTFITRSKKNKKYDHLIVHVVYTPPMELSSRSEKKKSISSFTHILRKTMTGQNYPVLVVGDFNAHTSSLKTLDERGLEASYPPIRSSRDVHVNGYGMELIEICRERKFLILNGRTERDEYGEFTYCHHTSRSGTRVNDYALVDSKHFQRYNFEVLIETSGNVAISTVFDHRPTVVTYSPEKSMNKEPTPSSKPEKDERVETLTKGMSSLAIAQTVNILSWNVRGLVSALKTNKDGTDSIKRRIFLRVIQNYDVICLLETFYAGNDISKADLIAGFEIVNQEPAKRTSCKGRGSGGIAIYRRKDSQICFDHDFERSQKCTVFCRFGSYRLGAVYVRPSDASDTRMPNPFKDVIGSQNYQDKMKERKEGKLLLLGDMNARTGSPVKINDIASLDSCLRSSNDVAIDAYGPLLIDFCSREKLMILNGRMAPDRPGEFTFCRRKAAVKDDIEGNSGTDEDIVNRQPSGEGLSQSVIDYCLVNRKVEKAKFRVLNLTTLESMVGDDRKVDYLKLFDHFPIEVKVPIEENMTRK